MGTVLSGLPVATKPTPEEFERAEQCATAILEYETPGERDGAAIGLARCFLSIHQSNTEIMALYDAAKAEPESLRAEVERLRAERQKIAELAAVLNRAARLIGLPESFQRITATVMMLGAGVDTGEADRLLETHAKAALPPEPGE